MKKSGAIIVYCILMLTGVASKAQFNDFLNYPVTVAPHESPDSTRGHFWGYMMASYYTVAHADSLNRGTSEYAGLSKGTNAFSLDRVYLGYDYFFKTPKDKTLGTFSLHVVAAYEQTTYNTVGNATTLPNDDRSFYLKYANMEWNNLFGTGLRLSVGAITTPSFAITEEPFWGYRSIDRTIMDMRGVTSSNDLGANIGGKIWSKKDADGNEEACVGFNFMVGNGTGAVPDAPNALAGDYTPWKKYYGDLYVKMFGDKVVLDLYGDGHTFSWTDIEKPRDMHQYELTGRAFLGYKIRNFNIGVEYFKQINYNMVAISPNKYDPVGDTTSDVQTGFSVMSALVLFRDKITHAPEFSLIARYDYYNPQKFYNPGIPLGDYNNMSVQGAQLPSTFFVNSVIEDYAVFGFDYQPIRQIHLMPNISFDGEHDRSYDDVPNADAIDHYDYYLVYRISFYYQLFDNR